MVLKSGAPKRRTFDLSVVAVTTSGALFGTTLTQESMGIDSAGKETGAFSCLTPLATTKKDYSSSSQPS